MLEPGQLSRFRMFCKKKYRCVGRSRQKVELIKGADGFFACRSGQDVSTDSILGVT
jgi:hypothetical protein